MAADRVSKALGERFSFTINNASASSIVVAILAAFLDTLKIRMVGPDNAVTSYTDPAAIVAAGYACDVVLDDGVILPNVTVTAANSKMNIRQFRNYIASQPRVLVDLTIQANNAEAFNNVIEVCKLSPLQGSGSQYLPLSDFLSIDQQQTNKININGVNLSMMFDTLMLMPVSAGHILTVSMKFS